jgi:hypothetical protein
LLNLVSENLLSVRVLSVNNSASIVSVRHVGGVPRISVLIIVLPYRNTSKGVLIRLLTLVESWWSSARFIESSVIALTITTLITLRCHGTLA